MLIFKKYFLLIFMPNTFHFIFFKIFLSKIKIKISVHDQVMVQIRKFHPEVKKVYLLPTKCPFCAKGIKQAKNLKAHLKTCRMLNIN